MIKKIVLTAAVAAFAASFASAPAFAMKKHSKMAKKCVAGQMHTGKPNSMGWGVVSSCGLDGKMYAMPARTSREQARRRAIWTAPPSKRAEPQLRDFEISSRMKAVLYS